MPSVLVSAVPSSGLKYTIVVDGRYIPLGHDNEEFVAVQGVEADGVTHYVSYVLFGKTGDTLSFTVTRNGRTLTSIDGARIFPEGEPYASGEVEFQL